MNDAQLRKRIVETMRRDDRAPDFDETWRAAEARHRRNRSTKRIVAGAAATVAAIAVAVSLNLPKAGAPMVEMTDLLGSTSWQAPSDVLLPALRTDIYQDLPDLTEYTGAAEEAFL